MFVKAGETLKGVMVELKISDLEMWDQKANKYVVEPGTYTITVGQSTVDHGVSHRLNVTA